LMQKIASHKHLFINDRSVQSPGSICAAMRRAVMRDGVKVVFIDYLQKIDFGERDSVREIERGMNLIAATARDLNVAVVALSQVPKSADKSQKSALISMADVKSSGAIAEAADVAISITDPNRHKEDKSHIRHLKFMIEGRDIPNRILDVQGDLRFGRFNSLVNDEPSLEPNNSGEDSTCFA
jgi:replicative DNA helicase